MQLLPQHLRFAFRQLRKNPGSSITAILTIGIGIGATTAIFSLVHAVLLRPLPYPEPDRLVSLSTLGFPPGAGNNAVGVPTAASYPDFFDWRRENHVFESLATYRGINRSLIGSQVAARSIEAELVSSGFFHVLGISPLLGRTFTPEEEQAGNRSVVLSYGLWQSTFAGSPSVLGQSVTLSGERYAVVGVMPAGFSFPLSTPPPALWTTIAPDAEGPEPLTNQRGMHSPSVIGRLRTGVSPLRAQAEMSALQQTLAARYPEANRNLRAVSVVSELTSMVGDLRPALRVLFGAVAALLLIACANVSGLLLARGSSRQPELAIRMSLGASRAEIFRQLLGESLLLSMLGGIAGIALAGVLTTTLLRLVPGNLPRFDQVSVDATALAFAAGVSLLTGLFFGVLPAGRLSGVDPAASLHDASRATSGPRQYRLHSMLVVAETALGLVLLIVAGLLLRSFLHILQVDPGFLPQQTLTVNLSLSDKEYQGQRTVQFYQQLLSRLASLPGVQAASAGAPLPLSGQNFIVGFNVQGKPLASGDMHVERLAIVEPNFLETLGVPLLRGRGFVMRDNEVTAPAVVAINEAFARKYFPGQDPLGQHLMFGMSAGPEQPLFLPREIIAVVGNVKQGSLTEDAQPEYFVPFGVLPLLPPPVVLRVAGDPSAYVNSVRQAVAGLDKQVPVYDVSTLQKSLSSSISQPRFQAVLITSFAAIALLLGSIGLYSLLSYIVVQRTREIGLRLALGAQRGDVLALVLRRGLILSAIGIAMGVVASALVARFLANQLYGMQPLDPATFIAVALLLLAVSTLACIAPAGRAARLDPMKTLRDQ